MRKLMFSFLLLTAVVAKAATITVTSKEDSGPGTLRSAIEQANANSTSADIIQFSLPGSTAADVTISLLSDLPALTSNIVIDGTTQPFSALLNTNIRVVLTRGTTDYINGIIVADVSNIEIYGMLFRGFRADPQGPISEKKGGIYLFHSSNIKIGAPSKPNCFTGSYAGILAPYATTTQFLDNLIIASNIFGMTEDGRAAAPNESGIDISFMRNGLIGGNTIAEGNRFGANTSNGIALGAAEETINVLNNVIGLDGQSGVISSNAANGIYVNGIGSKPKIVGNLIVGQATGILVSNVGAGFQISNNRIGTGAAGTENFGNNRGVYIATSQAGVIGGANASDANIIAYNKTGIFIEVSYPISILRNSIYCNTENAISFKDLPTGKSVTQSRISTITSAGASGTYLPNSKIELFYDDTCPDCQGKTWIATIPTGADGRWNYTGTLTAGITSLGTNADGATASFSRPKLSDQNKLITGTTCGGAGGSISNVTITDATTFTWYNAAGAIVGRNSSLANVPAGVYYLIAGQPGACMLQSPDYTIPNVDLVYKAKANVTAANCEKNNGSILVTGYDNAVPTQLTWRNESGAVVGNQALLSGISKGVYTLTASNGARCSNVAGVFTVGEVKPPILDLKDLAQTVSCDGKIITVKGIVLSGTTAPYKYAWFNSAHQQVYNNLNLTGVIPGNYELVVTDVNGCVLSSGILDFTDTSNRSLKVPNAFSPNGDTSNDTWKIEGAANYPTAEFSVFNRNGERVFYSKGYATDFDGQFNGKPLPIGVYYYIIDLKTDCPKLNGSLTLIR
ncbi:T9SS type B sorting domain-containing protein [Pedobacter duraquae]|uniref:Gliding motility-associated-like protein n=1 Tax=Pedobacter duraquae TaxID=425511 RepID=A0A4R6IE88_9SPHI|nr:gliding motility-associated C-terminal domain-containing protein [Pedobacter duraquae]TDO20046.1 gliding motility-associated-like protein [Pedobacter duraquae]